MQRTGVRCIAATAAPWGGPLRNSGRLHQALTAGWRAVAIGYAMSVACFTLLPSGASHWLFPMVDELVNPRMLGRLAVIGGFAAGLTLAVLAWRHRRGWMARFSWPLLGYLVVCLVGLAMLVLISQPPRYLTRLRLDELQRIPQEFDARHMIFYCGLAVVAASAWRGKVSLPVLGLLLMAYGYLLELAQHLVPTRSFRYKDLVSNGVGILLGVSWVYLYDSLFRARGTGLSRFGRRRRRGRALRDATRPSMQPRRS